MASQVFQVWHKTLACWTKDLRSNGYATILKVLVVIQTESHCLGKNGQDTIAMRLTTAIVKVLVPPRLISINLRTKMILLRMLLYRSQVLPKHSRTHSRTTTFKGGSTHLLSLVVEIMMLVYSVVLTVCGPSLSWIFSGSPSYPIP